jgi:hypothetical protein
VLTRKDELYWVMDKVEQREGVVMRV